MEKGEYQTEHPRDLLTRAIIASLQSWPELQRRIFMEVHYCGKAPKDVADQLGLQLAEVMHTLEQCELRLCRELKPLRNSSSPEIPEVSSPPQAYASGCCFR